MDLSQKPLCTVKLMFSNFKNLHVLSLNILFFIFHGKTGKCEFKGHSIIVYKEEANKVKQHSTPKAVTFHRKNELPQVGLEPTTLYTH